jgi:hypothetical protein
MKLLLGTTMLPSTVCDSPERHEHALVDLWDVGDVYTIGSNY